MNETLKRLCKARAYLIRRGEKDFFNADREVLGAILEVVRESGVDVRLIDKLTKEEFENLT